MPGWSAGQIHSVASSGGVTVSRISNTTQGESLAGFDLVSEMEGCNCCLVSEDIMIGDGQRYRDDRGHDMLCFKNSLVRLSNDKVDHRLQVYWNN